MKSRVNMKRIALLLLIILLGKIPSFSQTTSTDSTVCITSDQLKTINLIFLEHQKLSEENSVLKKEVTIYKDANDQFDKTISKKNKEIKLWKIGGITVSSCLLVLLLFK